MQRIGVKITPANLNIVEIVILNDTHTIAAPIVERMNRDPACIYSAYKIGHPNDDFVTINVQGNEHKRAKEIFVESIKTIIEDLEDIKTQLKKSNI